MPTFRLVIGFSPSEKDFRSSISKEDWKRIKNDAYNSSEKICEGCGYRPENHLELDPHVETCIMGEADSAYVVMLCRACHTIRHFDKAAEDGVVTFVNSIHSQEKLVEICSNGNGRLKSEINNKNIILLNSINVKEYAISMKSGDSMHSDKIKVIFGNKFDWGAKYSKIEEAVPEEIKK